MPAPKPKKAGRVLGLRLTDDEIKRFTAAAKARKQTVSEWMRGILNAGLEAS